MSEAILKAVAQAVWKAAAEATLAERRRCAEVACVRGLMSKSDRAEIVDSILSGEQP